MEQHKKKKGRPAKYLTDEDFARLPSYQYQTDPSVAKYMFTWSVSQQQSSTAPRNTTSINHYSSNDDRVCHSSAAFTDTMIDVIEQVNASNDIATTPEMSGLQDEIMGNDSTSQPHSNEHALITPDSVEDQFKQAILAYDFKGHEKELIDLFRLSFSHVRYLHSLNNLGIKDPEPSEVLAEALQKSIDISSIPTPYFILLKNVWIFAANEAACELLGIPEEDMMRLTMWELLHQDDIVRYLRESIALKVLPNRPPPTVYRLRTKVKPKTDSKPFSEALYRQPKKPIRWEPLLDSLHRAVHVPCSEYVTCVVERSTVYRDVMPMFNLLGCTRIDNVSGLQTD